MWSFCLIFFRCVSFSSLFLTLVLVPNFFFGLNFFYSSLDAQTSKVKREFRSKKFPACQNYCGTSFTSVAFHSLQIEFIKKSKIFANFSTHTAFTSSILCFPKMTSFKRLIRSNKKFNGIFYVQASSTSEYKFIYSAC